MRIAVILACHDRRDATVRALSSAEAALRAAGAEPVFTLFDDGSTDGTAAAVAALPFPVDRVAGDGTAFWARGMAVAERRAGLIAGDAEALLWLNDDVLVDPDAGVRLLAAAAAAPGAIVAGAVREPDGRTSYSGYRRVGLHPLRLRPVMPSDRLRPLDAFNGNLVLVPRSVQRRVGAIDGAFAHQLADIDYGLRARRLDVPVLLAPGTFGVCPTNPAVPPDGAKAEWRRWRSPKGGGHPGSMRRFLRRHAPVTWPVWTVQTAVLWWVRRGVRALDGLSPPRGERRPAARRPPRSR